LSLALLAPRRAPVTPPDALRSAAAHERQRAAAVDQAGSGHDRGATSASEQPP
jgi:hypothetical protein